MKDGFYRPDVTSVIVAFRPQSKLLGFSVVAGARITQSDLLHAITGGQNVTKQESRSSIERHLSGLFGGGGFEKRLQNG